MKKTLKMSLALMILILVFIFIFLPYSKAINAITYKYGSRADAVYTIQDKLKKWGYYKGSIDGIYGYETYLSVKGFQQKNGLAADGIAGDSTLEALGINVPSQSTAKNPSSSSGANNTQVMLLARLINGEARGEPYSGQVAVGAVVLNRTRDPRFPKTIAGVIYQTGAFTATVDGQIASNMEKNSINAARDAMNGWDPSGGAIYYFNPAKTTNKWIWSRPLIKIIGKHRFCR